MILLLKVKYNKIAKSMIRTMIKVKNGGLGGEQIQGVGQLHSLLETQEESISELISFSCFPRGSLYLKPARVAQVLLMVEI